MNSKSTFSSKQSVERRRGAFGDEVPGLMTVYSSFNSSLIDSPRATSFVRNDRFQRPLEKTLQIVDESNQVTYKIIRSTLGIGMTAIGKILHRNLKIRRLCCCWIQHNLTDAQK